MTGAHPRGDWPVGDLIARWCKQSHHSQRWLASKLGISEKYLSHVINGTALLRPELAVAIGEVTGLPARRLFHIQADRLIDIALENK